jgi:GAF domain-containing protein
MEMLRESTRLRPTPEPRPAAPAADVPDNHGYVVLADVSISLASTLDLTEILNKIVDGIIRVTGCERGCLLLRESEGEFSAFMGRYADQRSWDESSAREISDSVRNHVVASGDIFLSDDLCQLDEFKSNNSIQAGRIRAAACLPLLSDGRLTGVIYADSTFLIPRPLEASREPLRAFAALASSAIENARRHGELKSRRDRAEQQFLSLREASLGEMITRDRAMLDVFAMIERIAPLGLSVLFLGEWGRG